jgi:hypothetical protein
MIGSDGGWVRCGAARKRRRDYKFVMFSGKYHVFAPQNAGTLVSSGTVAILQLTPENAKL